MVITTPLVLLANPQLLLSPRRFLGLLHSHSSSIRPQGEGGGGGMEDPGGGRHKRGEVMASEVSRVQYISISVSVY